MSRFLHPRPSNIRPSRARWLLAFSLAAFPAGAALVLAHDGGAAAGTGFLLLGASLLALAPVASSRLQAVAMRRDEPLDEFELAQRHGALSTAYFILAALVVLGLLYARHAGQFGWWLPSGEDGWSVIFYGALLYVFFLPTTVLAFRQRDPLPDEQPEA